MSDLKEPLLAAYKDDPVLDQKLQQEFDASKDIPVPVSARSKAAGTSRVKKAALVGGVGVLSLITFHKGAKYAHHKMERPHHVLEGHHGFKDFDHSHRRPLAPNLAELSTAVLTLGEFDAQQRNATVDLSASKIFALQAAEGVRTTVNVEFGDAFGVFVKKNYAEEVSAEYVDEASLTTYVRGEEVDEHVPCGFQGLLISATAQESSYNVTLTVPRNGDRPLSLSLTGSDLVLPSILDFTNVNIRHLEVFTAGSGEGNTKFVGVNADEVKVVNEQVGGIEGSFTVKDALILKTAIGNIVANVSIAPRFPHNKNGSHPHFPPHRNGSFPHGPHKNHTKFIGDELHHIESRDGEEKKGGRREKGTHRLAPQHDDDAEVDEHEGSASDKDSHPPPLPKGPKKGPKGPHGPPPVFVLTETKIGSVYLTYTGSIHNKTSIISKSRALIGSVVVDAPKGFKGKFVEGSKIGNASVTGPNVYIKREETSIAGAFITGFVGNFSHEHPGNFTHDFRGCQHGVDKAAKSGKDSRPWFSFSAFKKFSHHKHHHDDDEDHFKHLSEDGHDEHHHEKKENSHGEKMEKKENKKHEKKHERAEKKDRHSEGNEETRGHRHQHEEGVTEASSEEAHDGEDGPHSPFPPPPHGAPPPPPPPDHDGPSPPPKGPKKGPDGPGGPPPPHGPPPHGPPHRHRPPPPPGFGAVFAFVQTGSVIVNF